MPNRFSNPFDQFLNSAGVPYAGGKLYFYATASSTPQATYNDPDLAAPHANSNPVVLDSAGRLPNAVFLQTLAYKVTFTDANDAQVWTADPVADSDFTAFAKAQTYAGNPNGNVAGTAGSGSGVTQIPTDLLWDRTNNLLYVCTTSGIAAAAVWTNVTQSIGGALLLTGVISPAQIAANTNDYAPTSFSTAYLVRLQSDAARNITGLAGGAAGRDILLSNIGTFNITLTAQDTSSSAGNRFLFPSPIVLRPKCAISLDYDATSSGWRTKAVPVAQPAGAAFKNLKVQTTASSSAAVTADYVVLEDTNGEMYRAVGVSLTLDVSTSGANGRDTGSETSSTWYSVWVIFNPTTNTVAGLLSISSTLGTITLPSGYTFGARVGWIRNDGSSNYLRTLQYGRVAQYTIGTNPTVPVFISGGVVGTYSTTAPTLSAVSVTSMCPTATPTRIGLIAGGIYGTGVASNVLVAPTTAWGGANNGPVGSNGVQYPYWNPAGSSQQTFWMTLEATTIAFASDASGGFVACFGWEDLSLS